MSKSVKLKQTPSLKWASSITIKLNDSDVIPSNLGTNGKIAWMTNKMWDYELSGNHLKAEYWRRKLEKFKGSSITTKRKQLRKIHKTENKKLQKEFDEKCEEIVNLYTLKIEKLNEESIELIQRLKSHQSEDRKVLKYALKTNYGNVGINKQILELRKVEYALGQSQKFIEAHRIKEQIEMLQKQRVAQHFMKQIKKDKEAREKLDIEHKKEMKHLLNKLAMRKTSLYRKLQKELYKLEIWKSVHDKRMDTEHHKDLLKLEKKLLAQAPPKHENRISHILNDDEFLVKENQEKTDETLKENVRQKVLRAFRRSQSLYDATKSFSFVEDSRSSMHAENERFEQMRNDKLDGKKGMDVVLSGVFNQYINGAMIMLDKYVVKVEVDDVENEIRWMRKHDDGLYKESGYDMMIECKMKFDDILDIQGPSQCDIFDEKNGFETEKCFSILGTSMRLHLEAESEGVMADFTQKLKEIVGLN